MASVDRMTASDYAFITFLGTASRARMSPDEQRLFDFHKGRRVDADPLTEQQIKQYAATKRKKK